MTVGVLVLAAGLSRRFGADKRLALLPSGEMVLAATLRQVQDSGLPAVVCIRAVDKPVRDVVSQYGMQAVACQRSKEGMGATLAEGISQIPPSWHAVLIVLGDMPWVQATTYQALAAELLPDTLCRPLHGGRPGHPIGFGERFFPLLMKSCGDIGARAVLETHASEITHVAVQDPGIHRDIDLPEDLRP